MKKQFYYTYKMNKFGIPVFEATVDNLDEGIMAIALVDFPAVESNFLVFKEQKQTLEQKYAIQDEDQHIITGVVMRANWPIYRYDESFGEYYIFYSPETIKIMAEKMIKDNTQNEINIMHNDDNFVEGVNLVELFIKDSTKGINPAGFEDIEEGSLFATYKVNNDEIWKEIKEGTFRGLSLEGYFSIEPSNKFEYKQEKNTFLNTMNRLFNKFLRSFVKCGSLTTVDDKEFYWVGEADLQIGDELFYNADGEEAIKVEDGEYELKDGTVIVVTDGVVSEIREVDGEKEDSLDNEVEMIEDVTEDFEEEAIETITEEPEASSEAPEDTIESRVDVLEAMIEDALAEIDALKTTLNELLSKPAAEPIVEEFNKKVGTTVGDSIPQFGSRRKLSY